MIDQLMVFLSKLTKVSWNGPQVSGLKYGAKYNYRVFAENAAGVSEPSNIIGPLLADDLHGENQSHSFHCLLLDEPNGST